MLILLSSISHPMLSIQITQSLPGKASSVGNHLHKINWGFSKRASLVAQLVKNLPAMWEAWVRSLGWEDPLEKGKATHSSILAWRIPWTV